MPAPRLLVTGFRPGRAGAGRVMINLMNGFAGAAVELHVLVPPGEFPELQRLTGLARVHVQPMDTDPDGTGRLGTLLADLSPEVVMSNRYDANALVVCAREGLSPSPRILWRVGIDIPEKLRSQNPFSRWRRRQQLKRTYLGADVFVLSSRSEGSPNALLDLLAVGTPAVSTDCPSATREILIDGNLGALVPVGDPRALSRAMLDALSSPADPESLKKRATDFLDTRAAARYPDLLFGDCEEGPANDGE